jgi:hypothetical protein
MRAFLWDRAFLSEPQPDSTHDHPVGLKIAIDPQELISAIWIGPARNPGYSLSLKVW